MISPESQLAISAPLCEQVIGGPDPDAQAHCNTLRLLINHFMRRHIVTRSNGSFDSGLLLFAGTRMSLRLLSLHFLRHVVQEATTQIFSNQSLSNRYIENYRFSNLDVLHHSQSSSSRSRNKWLPHNFLTITFVYGLIVKQVASTTASKDVRHP